MIVIDSGDTGFVTRMGLMNFCTVFDSMLPFADGSISEADRAHLLGLSPLIALEGAAVIDDAVSDGGDRRRDMDALHTQRILEDDKIILGAMRSFMENIVKCH